MTASDDYGCTSSSQHTVTICGCTELYVPSAFSPNADKTNEIFFAYGEGILLFHMNIFDRWGNAIFESWDISKGWDGTTDRIDSPQDVYLYQVFYSFECGGVKTSKFKQGNVTLLR